MFIMYESIEFVTILLAKNNCIPELCKCTSRPTKYMAHYFIVNYFIYLFIFIHNLYSALRDLTYSNAQKYAYNDLEGI